MVGHVYAEIERLIISVCAQCVIHPPALRPAMRGWLAAQPCTHKAPPSGFAVYQNHEDIPNNIIMITK